MLGEEFDRCLCGQQQSAGHKAVCKQAAYIVPEPSFGVRTPSKRLVDRLFPGAPCYYCGDKAENVDHLVPTSKGGNGDRSNKVPACHPCNQMKGNMMLDEFIARMERILQTLRSKKVIQFPIQFGGSCLWNYAREEALYLRWRVVA
jgi:5-methylcytosine-specific restriction endonuclease McrA